ncbi:Flagellar FlaF family protein [Magnetospirillum molischianum]|uniref:Putative Flagellar FlaF family protein n=1 Tax=Magnetospirillum molischianum DSM 120 TaxID=1150626 RepID=H8FRP5_MAGML|nr:Flagellar FlaF family protein [Magnetospirillum molischianum]CCG41033.1 putative Flagellar FlaF family protein [Magnetospirillum molischianum DSM 120]
MTVNAYDQTQREMSTGRAAEARALTRCAMALNDAIASKDNDALYEAVRLNYRLWLLFYSEIENNQVDLPLPVRNNVLALASYVVNSATRAFSGEQKVLETLININRNIAAGLMEMPPDTAKTAPSPETAQQVPFQSTVA